MKAIHKKIIRLQARKMTLCLNGTYYLGKSRADYHRRSKEASDRNPYTKEFDAVIKHNNAWFNSIPEQLLVTTIGKRAALLRFLLSDQKGHWPDWAIQDWTGSYDWRKKMTEFCGRIVTQHKFQK